MSFNLDKTIYIPPQIYTATSAYGYGYNSKTEALLKDPILKEKIEQQLKEQEENSNIIRNAGCKHCSHYVYHGYTDFCDCKKLERYNHLTGEITFIYVLPCSAKNTSGECEDFVEKIELEVIPIEQPKPLTWRDRVWVLWYNILKKIYERLG